MAGASATASGAVTISFEALSADGLALKDVLSTNPDGTTNNCSARPAPLPSCCAHMPPFEVRTGASDAWVRVARDQIRISGSTVVLQTASASASASAGAGAGAAATVTAVRYAWADYIDCVLANADGLPAGPFVQCPRGRGHRPQELGRRHHHGESGRERNRSGKRRRRHDGGKPFAQRFGLGPRRGLVEY